MTRVLLTGATGLFGRYLARELLARECAVVAVARGRNDAEARRRVLAAVQPRAGDKLFVVRGDVGEPGLALAHRGALRGCNVLLHSAATTEFGLPLEAARRSNVDGTRNVLELARTLPQLESIGHVGTAFVAGRRIGRVYEHELRHSAGFVNTYEQTKYEAELLARSTGLPVTVFRPGVIAEDERSNVPSALRFALQLIARGFLPMLPSPTQATLDVIGARDAAAAVVELLLSKESGGAYHITSGDTAPPLADVVLAGTGRTIALVEPDVFDRELARLRDSSHRAAGACDRLATFVGALAHPKVFDTRRAERALGRPVVQTDPLLLVGRVLEAAA